MSNLKTSKQNSTYDPFENLILDDYEKELSESIARGEWKSVDNVEEHKKMWQEAAHRHAILNQSKKVTLRVNQGDLIKLKVKAKKTNMPYQTLLNVLIRDFVDGDYTVKL